MSVVHSELQLNNVKVRIRSYHGELLLNLEELVELAPRLKAGMLNLVNPNFRSTARLSLFS